MPNHDNIKVSTEDSCVEPLSPQVLDAYAILAKDCDMQDFDLQLLPISGVGENSYGLVLQVKVTPRVPNGSSPTSPFFSILKISPKNSARRAHMKVVDYYAREVFMYEKVLRVFADMQSELVPVETEVKCLKISPEMLHCSLTHNDEFIIFEDLQQQQYVQNSRSNLLTFDLVTTAIKTVAQLHAMSFVLQAQRPQLFRQLVSQMRDNLFTPDIEPISIEFGRNYVRRTRHMIEQDSDQEREQMVHVLQAIEDNFKSICLGCVDGGACAPYAVICHGDFWNNNIMYRFDSNHKATHAKLIDFQMSRYASPVLDVVHYLFACTEKQLRDKHFREFLDTYYTALTQHLQLFRLDSAQLYPREIYEQHLCKYGVYGFCMSAFSIPFFISTSIEIPDLDEVSEAIKELSDSSSKQAEHQKTEEKRQTLLEEYDLLTKRTEPIFKRRMTGIVMDLIKYGMIDHLQHWNK